MTACMHRWLLEPDKNSAYGRCALCKAERMHTGGIVWGERFTGGKPPRTAPRSQKVG